jgi:hypothetical protein
MRSTRCTFALATAASPSHLREGLAPTFSVPEDGCTAAPATLRPRCRAAARGTGPTSPTSCSHHYGKVVRFTCAAPRWPTTAARRPTRSRAHLKSVPARPARYRFCSRLPLQCPARAYQKRPWIKCSSIPHTGAFPRISAPFGRLLVHPFLRDNGPPNLLLLGQHLLLHAPASLLLTCASRDACAHLLLPLNKCRCAVFARCTAQLTKLLLPADNAAPFTAKLTRIKRRETLYAPWKCTELRHGLVLASPPPQPLTSSMQQIREVRVRTVHRTS